MTIQAKMVLKVRYKTHDLLSSPTFKTNEKSVNAGRATVVKRQVNEHQMENTLLQQKT